MSDWQSIYNSRLTTFDNVAQQVRSGDCVGTWLGPCAPPVEAINAIFARKDELTDIKIYDGICVFPYPFLNSELMQGLAKKGWVYQSGYVTPASRASSANKTVDAVPVGSYPCGTASAAIWDVCFCMCTPPNPSGYVNLSIVGMHGPTTIIRGKQTGRLRLVVAVVNEQLPVVFGPEQWIHVSEIDYFVEASAPLMTSARAEPGELEAAIGGYVSEFIEDRSTLQIGWGGIGESVFQNLQNRRDLGILTEMMPGGLGRLVEDGIVTNKYKPEFTGVSVAAFAFGDQDLYDFIAENAAVNIVPTETSNAIPFIGKHPKLVAINGALQINLKGEVAAHGLGETYVSGPGGQLEFMIATQYSRFGRGINVMASTRVLKNGETASNIVTDFPLGTPVTIPESVTDTIITEYGVAKMIGRSRRQRAYELVSIAHPDFRAELRDAMLKKTYFTGYEGGLEYWDSPEYMKNLDERLQLVKETFVS